MKNRLLMILLMLGVSFGFMMFGAQTISTQDTGGDGVEDFINNFLTTPNPEKIAFASDRDGNWEIYVMNADGTNQINLTNNPAWDTIPSWGEIVPPEKKKIAG